MATQVSLNSGAVASAGALAIQTNGTTQAVSISTGQVATLAQNPILTSGTANGVAYLNGSNVLTTGSALVFDGTNLGLGVTPSAWNTNYRALDVGGVASVTSYLYTDLWYNSYVNSGGTIVYKNGGYSASRFSQDNGTFKWFSTGSTTGTAGGTATFTQAMTLDASGNLGVGTTSPSKRLSLRTSSADVGITLGTGGNAFNQDIDFFNSVDSMSGRIRYYPDGGFMSFWTASNERARIDSSGNLLVGTTSNTPSGGTAKQYNLATGTTVGLAVSVDNTGYSLINFFYNNATLVGTITTNGTTTAYNTSSDYRLKNTIAPMTGALAKVALLKPCTYKWNTDGSDGEGFIAHELAEVAPQCVTGEKDAVDEDGNPKYQGIDTSFLIATLTAAIQEQHAIITQLTARITALETA